MSCLVERTCSCMDSPLTARQGGCCPRLPVRLHWGDEDSDCACWRLSTSCCSLVPTREPRQMSEIFCGSCVERDKTWITSPSPQSQLLGSVGMDNTVVSHSQRCRTYYHSISPCSYQCTNTTRMISMYEHNKDDFVVYTISEDLRSHNAFNNGEVCHRRNVQR
jgi:hypothetical protein